MKLASIHAALGPAALLLLLATGCRATPAHEKLHQRAMRPRHFHGHAHWHPIAKRGKMCEFPTDDPNLVAITPEGKNAGWAMSPDQECRPGHYCPIACKPGMVMAQWDPHSDYTYPSSMNGGLHCGEDGIVRKPFPDRPNCVEGTGTVRVVNQCRNPLSWCQTILPGNELMAIPTLAEVETETTISVPGASYWRKTSAHYYVNPPGTGVEGCIWGSESQAIGNWSPFVVGANTERNGMTFVKIGWNPKFLELDMKAPGFSLKIECPDGGCVGLPCEIRSSSGKGSVESKLAAAGAGGAKFCVVTVPKGKVANVVVTEEGSGGKGGGGGGGGYPVHSSKEAKTETVAPPPEPSTTVVQEPTTVPEKMTTTPEPLTTQQSTTIKTTTKPPPPPPPPVTTSATTTSSAGLLSPAYVPITTSKNLVATTSSVATTTSGNHKTSNSTMSSTTSKFRRPTMLPGAVFNENATAPTGFAAKGSVSSSWSPPQATPNSPPNSPAIVSSKKGEAGRQQGNAAVAGLVVAFVAAACFF
ncbi:beta-glucosidase (SUN family) domain-containing protein [Hirsutella rhossiliensis]|uniref:Beta-glucosidase (SUN family) domain-containing protein n=1 Tax=Hirsutella rhossiliensis TaxID=111463 RepID=A0A9P8N2M9_9HYPO|nr:beta-glucosidase (SUN family) domain-containing protein [Hirsutella rhossiliensis]KAH0965724.1 beta-glucosidase (SUN family) domain-containing protein [Hirsutella rhossiliensis]